MNVLGAVVNTVKPTGQDPNNPGAAATNGSEHPWLISTVAKAVGTIAGAGKSMSFDDWRSMMLTTLVVVD